MGKVDEFVAYGQSTRTQPKSTALNHLSPLVAIMRQDGSISYRDMTRADINRIVDETPIPGGWLFKQGAGIAGGGQGSNTWVRRFCLIRNMFMFFFHSSHNEKPVSVLPLQGCEILIVPRSSASSTVDMGEEYEFQIRHPERGSLNLYALSESVRADWIKACEQRANIESKSFAPPNVHSLPLNHMGRFEDSNVTITNVLLQGDSSDDQSGIVSLGVNGMRNNPFPFAPPPIPGGSVASGDNDSVTHLSASSGQYAHSQQHSVLSQNSKAKIPEREKPHSEPFKSLSDEGDENLTPPSSPETAPGTGSFRNAGGLNRSYDFRGNDDGLNVNVESPDFHLNNSSAEEKGEMGGVVGVKKTALHGKVEQIHEEARERELHARNHRHASTYICQSQESQNPMTLAEMFRYLLFFAEEELVEDPLPSAPMQIPHFKGEYSETMMTGVYQHYCNESGYMSLEEFVNFMEDIGVTRTHVPRDFNDIPNSEMEENLNPVKILITIPRNLGYTTEMLIAATKSPYATRSNNKDSFLINFTQFYHIVLKIAQTVYPSIYAVDATLATQKILQESMVPLYAWCNGHIKNGAVDLLVTEERIPLLLSTYSPNLWKVFLMYAHDILGKLPHVNMLAASNYPQSAKLSEKQLFGVPEGAPYRPEQNSGFEKCDPLIIDESGLLRLCTDYGIIPHIMSRSRVKEIYKKSNKEKKVMYGPPPTRISSQATNTSKFFTASSVVKMKTLPPRQLTKPMFFGGAANARNMSPPSSPAKSHTHLPSALPPRTPGTGGKFSSSSSIGDQNSISQSTVVAPGLGFSEFIEVLGHIAIEGLDHEDFQVIFPTPLSKVLGLLTVWGLADMKKIEEVRAIRVDSVI